MNFIQLYTSLMCLGVFSLCYGGLELLCGMWAEWRAARLMCRLDGFGTILANQFDRDYGRHFEK